VRNRARGGAIALIGIGAVRLVRRWRERAEERQASVLASVAAITPASVDGSTVPVLREIVLSTEDEAAAEVARQQEAESDPETEWIYLRNADGVWVARQVPCNWQPPPMTKKQAFFEALLNGPW
jgi:hypothetical protein